MAALLVDIAFDMVRLVLAAGLLWGGWLAVSTWLATREEGDPEGASREQGVYNARLGLRLLVSAAFAAGILASPECMADQPTERALQEYRAGRFTEALKAFEQAASQGDARAQEVVAFMYLHGPSLYGAAVPQDRGQAVYWFGRAAKAGREVAQHMLCVLSGRPANTVVDRGSCVAPLAAMR